MMIHPLLRLAVKEPHLLVDHLSAYAALAGEEVSKTTGVHKAASDTLPISRHRPHLGRRRERTLLNMDSTELRSSTAFTPTIVTFAVSDPEVLLALSERSEGSARSAFLATALKVGVPSLKAAKGTLD